MQDRFNSNAREYITRIERRIQFLKDRIASRSVASAHHDRAEVNALEWALTLITDEVDTTRLNELYNRHLKEKENCRADQAAGTVRVGSEVA